MCNNSEYDFNGQLGKGQDAEKFLDAHFSDKFTIRDVTMEEQRRGIDRFFERKEDGKTISVEYKADWKAQGTGNAFVETISVDKENKPGWALYSQADYLLYYIPGPEVIYVMKPCDVREKLEGWTKRYRKGKSPNKGYFTIGVLVPLMEFEKCSVQVISL